MGDGLKRAHAAARASRQKTPARPPCDYDTGTAQRGDAKCGKPSTHVWTDWEGQERPVCGTHARSVRAKWLPGGGSLRPVSREGGPR